MSRPPLGNLPEPLPQGRLAGGLPARANLPRGVPPRDAAPPGRCRWYHRPKLLSGWLAASLGPALYSWVLRSGSWLLRVGSILVSAGRAHLAAIVEKWRWPILGVVCWWVLEADLSLVCFHGFLEARTLWAPRAGLVKLGSSLLLLAGVCCLLGAASRLRLGFAAAGLLARGLSSLLVVAGGLVSLVAMVP